MRVLIVALLSVLIPASSWAGLTKSHGYAQFGELKYPANFAHFAWVNPDAPKGGTVRLMAPGTFDTLNPYTLKGMAPSASGNFLQYGVSELNETLMAGSGIYDPSGDEPTSSYGLIAHSIEYADDRSWVVFNLRPEAQFHDGHPIDANDVAFSYRTLLEKGHPTYRTSLQDIVRVDVLNSHRIRFVFKQRGNALNILRLGELPVLPEHYWQGRDFTRTGFEVPLGSGPYRITEVQPGRRLVFSHVANWWGEDLPVNRGKYNFDRVIIEFYRDSSMAFEAFKAGEFDLYIDNQAKNWATAYQFPAVTRGDVIKAEIPHQIPTQSQALFMNSRRALFSDKHLREALGLMFDFEWTNRALFYNAYQRSESFYPNSDFAARQKPVGQELQLLTPYKAHLPKALFSEPFSLPQTSGNGIPRQTLRRALSLFEKAGFKPSARGMLNKHGEPLRFEILLVNPNLERILQPFRANLARIGIDASIRTVDRAQYKHRLDAFDFDMVLLTLPQTLSPGTEQWAYFHSSQADLRGGKNYAGIKHPVVDAMLEKLLTATSREQQIAAARAIDRILLWEHYSIPNWYISHHRVAYRNRFAYLQTPPYTLGLRSWWLKSSETSQ